jgi:glycosyltransferase involved in cell wall biosynthesis
MKVYMVAEYFWPGIGGLENSTVYLAEALRVYHSPEILTPVSGNGGPACFQVPIRRFPEPNIPPYLAMWEYINPGDSPFAACLFGFSARWLQAQLDFIGQCRDSGALKVTMKIPTWKEFSQAISTLSSRNRLLNLHRLICPNPVIREALIQQGFPAKKAVYIPNGVPVDKFTPADPLLKKSLRRQLGLPGNQPVFIFTGRFAQRKRVDLLVDAFRQVPEAHLVILGYFDNRFDDGSRFDLTGAENIHLFGPVFDVLPFLRAADIYVTASNHEGLSNSVLEALACGLPVIATRIPGHLEVIEPGCNGQLFSPGDMAGLVEQIHWFIRRIDSLPHFSASARDTVCKRFDISATAARYHINLSEPG